MHAAFPIHFNFLVFIMKLRAAMVKIKSMNMELKVVALRQDMSDMEKVILMTAEVAVISGLKVKLLAQQ